LDGAHNYSVGTMFEKKTGGPGGPIESWSKRGGPAPPAPSMLCHWVGLRVPRSTLCLDAAELLMLNWIICYKNISIFCERLVGKRPKFVALSSLVEGLH